MDELSKLHLAIGSPFSASPSIAAVVGTYTSSLSTTQGFHTTSTINIKINISDLVLSHNQRHHDRLHVVYILPPCVFADRYELEQRHQDGTGPSFRLWGETNLELPVEAVDPRGSALLLTIQRSEGDESVQVPLHMRYMLPRASGGHVSVRFPWPTIFWASDEDSLKLAESLWYRRRTNVSAMFLRPSQDPFYTVKIPTGNLDQGPLAVWLTLILVLFSFLYVARGLWVSSIRLSRRRAAVDKYK
ncbi:hypothetical protein BS47DRAFT_1351072 [Hydnum rufescens UP504]|uniref:Protein PBN1 n=1 Tax=Hydnum rufescens UP504 TaxID=1448309 RepID=A0A9P6DQY7_9AGAM|nr:hypothetical protein BS47DRAFT_1351072 [Hydnum rufescens UP504]